MAKPHLVRFRRYYLRIYFVILICFLIFLSSGLSAKERNSEFTFNTQSEYWPTYGWKTSTPEMQGMSSKDLIGLFEQIESKKLPINSVLVIRNGYIVAEANIQNSKSSLYQIYSSTKSISSALVGIAITKKYIKSIDQPIIDFFPNLDRNKKAPLLADITLKHLLTMSCGFEWPEIQTSYLSPSNPLVKMLRSQNWNEYLFAQPIIQQPGQLFNYNSGCAHLSLSILRQAGLNVSEFAQKYLFTPLGIEAKHYKWEKDPRGTPNGSHGLHMSPRDMAKFGYLYLKGGFWEGSQIIPKSWVIESTMKHIKMTWGGKKANYYGYYWYVHSLGFHSLGYYGQYIFVIPNHEIVVVFTSRLSPHDILAPIHLLEKYILPAVKNSIPLDENSKAYQMLRSKIKTLYGDNIIDKIFIRFKNIIKY